MVWFVVLVVLVMIVSLATRDAGSGEPRRRTAPPPSSKYDTNPALANAEYRTAMVARLEQREGVDGEERAVDDGTPVESVIVARLDNPTHAQLVRGLLLSAGIPVAPMPMGQPHIYRHEHALLAAREIVVPAHYAEEARSLIAEIRRSQD